MPAERVHTVLVDGQDHIWLVQNDKNHHPALNRKPGISTNGLV